jgi:hypothetical protein
MIGHELSLATADNYRRFAAEIGGRSPLYEELTSAVADDAEVLAFLAGLPRAKRQPNLLLAAVRYLAGIQPGYAAFRAVVLERRAEVAAVMVARRTQTNEPARCAVLLPALALLPQPLALLEVGASAGLCLLPDRYSYDYASHDNASHDDGRHDDASHDAGSHDDGRHDYGRHRLAGDPGAPVLRCDLRGPVPLPAAIPQVAWRAGIDLNPLDVAEPDDVHWLSCLLWPGEGDRAERLAAAVEVARRDPPRIVRGDLVERLADVAAGAPAGATLVVFHSAVLAYLSPARRAEFAAAVRDLDAVWLSAEAPAVLADLPGSPSALPPPPDPGAFVIIRDGREAVAYADGHGAYLSWLP